ncbi:MAG: hypothetical protein KatS3mg040_1792 [Candidatus Kapaibacterium sp.]|nr:MAG: hypothetical protein KatS3mg040_1792 [Candidatus Kapabacteria bacterium]
MTSVVLLVFSFWLLVLSARAEIDTSRGLVGSTLCFRRMVTQTDSCVFRCVVRLSNPTVWYPQSARIGQSAASLRRESDTLWQLEALQEIAGSVDVELCGVVLAGSDSVCIVRLDAESQCLSDPESLEQVLIVRSVGPQLPYLRFARLEGPFPMPMVREEPFAVIIALDATSRAVLQLFDVLGRVVTQWAFELERGVHRVTLTLPMGTSPGLYVLRLESSKGSAAVPVIVE